MAEVLIIEAAGAAERGEECRLLQALQALGALRDRGGARATIAAALSGFLVTALGSAWDGGWQPADIVRVVSKRLGTGHRVLARQLIAAEAHTWAGSDVAIGPVTTVGLSAASTDFAAQNTRRCSAGASCRTCATPSGSMYSTAAS